MAERMRKRAGIEGEQAVTVAFGFSSLPAAIILAVLEQLGPIGDLASIVSFGFHRIVLVTDKQTYVFRSRPFHRPGAVLASYPVGPGSVLREGGKLTFADGRVVWHSPLFKTRVKLTEAAATGQLAMQAA